MPRAAIEEPASREVERTDRRWLAVTATIFAVAVCFLAGAYGLYRATGPHPQVRAFVRQVKHAARRVLPAWRPPREKGAPQPPWRRISFGTAPSICQAGRFELTVQTPPSASKSTSRV